MIWRTLKLTFGGRQPHPGNGNPSVPSGHGASNPGTPCSPLSPRSPFLPRLPKNHMEIVLNDSSTEQSK